MTGVAHRGENVTISGNIVDEDGSPVTDNTTFVITIAGNNYKVCDLILDLSSSYGKLVRKKKAA